MSLKGPQIMEIFQIVHEKHAKTMICLEPSSPLSGLFSNNRITSMIVLKICKLSNLEY